MLRALIALGLIGLLASCGAEPKWAPDADVARATYTHPGPKTLTLITAINNRSGSGGHSALLVSASERVLFDPAGTWWHPNAPERNDVLFGINPTLLDYYIDFHARETFHVVTQDIDVTPELAEKALALVKAHGAAPKAACAQSISGILQQLGFAQVNSSWWPHKVMDDFADIPGVREDKIYDDSPDNNYEALKQQRAFDTARRLAQ